MRTEGENKMGGKTKHGRWLAVLLLAAAFTLGIAAAAAAVQLDAPTDLIWGRDYNDDGSYTEMPGLISFVSGMNNQSFYWIAVYKTAVRGRQVCLQHGLL